jgi:hypothetical protein
MADQKFVEYDFWMTFDYTGTLKGPSPRVTKNEPQTGRGERAVRCKARLPLSLFATPAISMVMNVPYRDTPDVLANVTAASEAFKQTLGFDVEMRIIPSGIDADAGEETEA